MIKSPLIEELKMEWSQDYIITVLEARFEAVPPEVAVAVRAIQDVKQLIELMRLAGTCSDLDAFRAWIGA